MAENQTTYSIPTDRYWALDSGPKVCCYLEQKRKEYYDFLLSSGFQEKIRRNWNYYHGQFSRLPAANGEMAIKINPESGNLHLALNEFGPLVRQLAILTTENPPAWDTMAREASHSAIQQTILGNDILDYEMDGPHHCEEHARSTVEDAYVFTAGYTWSRWESDRGKEVGAIFGEPAEYEGDLRHSNPNFYQVIYPFERPWRDKEWVWILNDENVWDLVAQFPKLRDKILSHWRKGDHEDPQGFQKIGAKPKCSDSIEVGYFYHSKRPCLPWGRRIRSVGDCPLEDTYKSEQKVWDMGYGEASPEEAPEEASPVSLILDDLEKPEPEGWDLLLPIHRVIPSRYLLTSLGWTVAFDLQGFNEALNGEVSTILSNHKNFAQIRIWSHISDETEPEVIDEGCVLVKSNQKPEALNFAQPIPEAFELVNLLRAIGEAISGVNAVARGIPTEKASSGVALALIDQKAQQAASFGIANFFQFLCDWGTAILQIYQKHALSPRAIAATSGNTRTAIKTFTAGDLDLIERVSVKTGNPLSRTIAGRFELAKFLVESQLVTNKEEILTVLATGNYKPLVRAEMSELAIISDENERLARGEPVRASPFDNIPLHIREHHAYLDSTELRQGAIGERFVAHLENHLDMLRDPAILEKQLLLGFTIPPQMLAVLQPPPPPPGAPGAEGGPPAGPEDLEMPPEAPALPPPALNGNGGAPPPRALSPELEPAGGPAESVPTLPVIPEAVAARLKSARLKGALLR